MLNRRLRVLGTAACAVVLFTMFAGAQEPDSTGAGATAAEAPELAIDAAELFLEPFVPIPAGVKIHTAIVTPGPEGSSVEMHRSVAGEEFDTMACNNAPDSIYCNTAGPSLFGTEGTSRFSDDIVTVANAGCLIDRFVIRVTGDKKQDGSGVALGGYTVNYALFQTCPSAEFTPRVIAGTEGSKLIEAICDGGSNDLNPCLSHGECPGGTCQTGDIIIITHQVPEFTDVRLPSVEFFLGINFSRDKCASVVGAPALKGYSGDRLALPGVCAALGASGNSSLYAEIYARGECTATHVGYRNSNQGKAANSAGVGKRLADDLVLPEDCMLVAYEVSFKKAVIEIDLRTSLGGENGPFIPGTRDQFPPCFGCDVQVAHVDVDPPFRLAAGFPLWFTAKSDSSSLGVVQTCEPPLIGESANLFMVFNSGTNTWEVENENDDSCFGGFDVTLYCEGPPPPGACCDMVLKECLGGTEEGKPCKIGAQCDGLRCESVCRDVPRINCTADEIGVPLLWKEGNTCGPVCTAGGALGKACADEADCTACRNGGRDGELCCEGGTCGPPICQQRPELTCSTDADCHVCIDGGNDGLACTGVQDCPDGVCDLTDVCGMVPTCIGGMRPGLECCPDGSCPSGVCDGAFCEGGTNNGDPCTREVDCPGGSCDGGPFARSCGVAACCKPTEDPEAPGICQNLTLNECNAVVPQGAPRDFQVGRGCGVSGQRCPISACLLRSGSCTQEDPTFCVGGMFDGDFCDFFAFPGDCVTNFETGNYCGGNCVGGSRSGEICDPNGFFAPSCDGLDCQNCDNDPETDPPPCPAFCGNQCPNGICEPAFCRGNLGCGDRFCCSDVCELPNMFICCEIHWTESCANRALDVCPRQVPANDECFGVVRNQPVQARLLRIPDTFQADSISAEPFAPSGGLEPGFCCNNDNPGGQGVGTLWYKFIAVDTSVRIQTCGTDATIVNDENGNPIEYRGEDSMIAVYSVPDPRRGICSDLTQCDVLAPDCADGSECVFDEQFTCDNLSPLACNDDESTCDGGFEPKQSRLCVTGLVPGLPYYVQLAGKSNDLDPFDPKDPRDSRVIRGNGKWRVTISSPCFNDLPQMFNDACADGEEVTGGDVAPVVSQFDLSGTILGQCVGGSTEGAQCVVAGNNCGNGICRRQAAATFDCPGPPFSCINNTMINDIWYDWIAPANGAALVDACGPTNATTPDTGMVVYEGCECPVDSNRIVGCSWLEPSPCSGGSKVRFPVTQGTCYQIRLGGHRGGEPEGELKFSVGDFCGNGQFDPNRCVGGTNANLECVANIGCPGGVCGEECDGGLACLPDCTCDEFYEPSFFPSPNCSAICGDGTVVVPEQCDGGLECNVFCTCNFGSQPTVPPSLDCVLNCGNGALDFGEECDSGTGCCIDCTCGPGHEAIQGSIDCNPVSCAIASPGKPAQDGILPRTAGTVIKIQYNMSPTAIIPTIRVRELLDGGGFGPNLSGSFTIVNEGLDLVVLTDNGASLANRTWYGVTDDCNNQIDYLVMYGNVDGDSDTDALDANAIWMNRLNPVEDNTPFDIDGDGDVDALDVNAAWNNRDALVAPIPAKPTGHTCQ